jgi:hypothetical protein
MLLILKDFDFYLVSSLRVISSFYYFISFNRIINLHDNERYNKGIFFSSIRRNRIIQIILVFFYLLLYLFYDLSISYIGKFDEA